MIQVCFNLGSSRGPGPLGLVDIVLEVEDLFPFGHAAIDEQTKVKQAKPHDSD